MDPSPVHTTPPVEEEDEWDTDGFVIPSLGIGDLDQSKANALQEQGSKPPPPKAKREENIYLGPHGAPPSQSKQQALYSRHKQQFKQKLKEKLITGPAGQDGRIRWKICESPWPVGINMSKGTPREWLDPHCHESQFEKWNPQ